MASSPPQFFMVILPPSLEHKKLRIPPKFVRDFGHELSEDVTLAVPNGRPWRVRLKRDEGGVWFDDGWHDFAKYYSVSAGYFSVFKYDKNSNFRVLIFDFTACEINYKREEGSKLDKRSRQSAANYSFENFKAKQKYHECEPQIKKCRKEELVEKNGSDGGGSGGGGGGSGGGGDIEYNLWDLLAEMGICISKKHGAFSTVESKRVLKIARSLNLKYPTSLIILPSSSITHNRVYVPATFAKHFASRDAKSMEVRVSNEGHEFMNMNVCWRENGGFALSMTELVEDENLKEGDIFIFELISKRVPVLNLSIYHL